MGYMGWPAAVTLITLFITVTITFIGLAWISRR